MSGDIINWLYVLEEKLHPNALINTADPHSGFSYFFDNLKKDLQRFRPYFIHLVSSSKSETKATLIQLTHLSNTVYHYMVDSAWAWSEHPFSSQVRQLYRQILIQLEISLEFCGKFDNTVLSTLPLTDYSTSGIRMQLQKKINTLHYRISKTGIEPAFGELVLSGLKLLIRKKGLSRLDTEYADLILVKLEELKPFSTFELEKLLYQYDFNTPALFNYCAKCCNDLIMDTPNLHAQLGIIIGLEDRINGLPARTTLRWASEDESIRKQLRTFFKEKKVYIRQQIKLRREEIQDSKFMEEPERVQINLPVAQFGLFIRLFIEKGLLPKEDVGKTFAYYARHFSTPKTPFISADSLQKKSTDVEFSTAKKMKGHLIGMVNWLNEHYNTS